MNARDAKDVQAVARIAQREVTRNHFPRVHELIARGAEGLSYRRVCNILRKYPAEVAEAAGLARVRYSKAEYITSGAGAFGRLGGGKRGKYHAPRVLLEARQS